mmetsp:Transcript_110789/g.320167  ORF Transcript_110789/g.320167 Transcript_110789/m.320167 type:complete len:295 (-) Transcript_110789:198-1082(-)
MAALFPVVAFVPVEAVMPVQQQPQACSMPMARTQVAADMTPVPVPPPSPAASSASTMRKKTARPAQKTAPPQRQCAEAFKKTAICRYYPKCHQGDQCKFAHTTGELRVRPNLTKTRMCAGFYDGRCRLSASECGFAHGEADLRPREVPYYSDPLPSGYTSKRGQPSVGRTSSYSETASMYAAPSTSAGSSPTHSSAGSVRSCRATPTMFPEADPSEEPSPLSSPRSSAGSWSQNEVLEQAATDESATVSELLRQFLEDIKAADGTNKEHVPAFFPTPGECQEALLRAMPEYYEE